MEGGEIASDAPVTSAVLAVASAAAASGWPGHDSAIGQAPAAGDDPWAAAPPAEPPAAAPLDATAVFVVPTAEGPRATIREIRPDRSSCTFAFEGRPLTIGRSSDNGLVLRDGRASRHHARIDVRRGSLVLTDLGSTNGSWVNDRRVESIALGEGDQVRIVLDNPHHRAANATRPRSLAVSPDRRTAVFIEDHDTSDLHVLDLTAAGAHPERLTTGRPAAPYWEDTQPRISPVGDQIAYGDDGHVWLVPTAGGPPRRLVEADGPV